MFSVSPRRNLRHVDRPEHLARVLNSIPHVTWSADADGHLTFVSHQWERDFGGSVETFLANGWLDHIHPDDRQQAAEGWRKAITSPKRYSAEFRFRMPYGEYKWVCVRGQPEMKDGSVARWFGTCTDVTERVQAREELEESERLYRGVLEATADCIKILSPQGNILLMNAPGLKTMEIQDFSQVDSRYWPSLWPEDMRQTVEAALASALEGQTARFSGYCPTAENTPKWWDVVVTPMNSADGSIKRLLASSRDMTADRQKTQDLLWTSEHDVLTALPNRRSFQKRLHAAALRAMNSDSRLGLLVVDLDHFKHVNDTLGHEAGDALLVEFAARLKQSIRSSDFVARLGGDEFAIVMENVADGAELLRTGESIVQRLRSPLRVEGRVLSGGASIGGALFPDDAAHAHDLFKLADTALYALKAEGRGGTKLFQSHMREEAQRVSSQLSLARVALTEASVVPHYQVKVDLTTGHPNGIEALLRWKHPSRGIQPPETIEEAFKDYELATKIGHLMQTKVFEDLKAWRRQGLDFGRISINAAPVEFLRNDFAERFLQRLEQAEISPEMIELEVTEHVLMDRGSRSVGRALALLKAQGVKIALDDFGTGYSSLSHLRDYPVDVVKIDKSFVTQIEEDQEIRAIVDAVVKLAASLRIVSVAEGVETAEQANMLRQVGCNLGQGFLYGRPVDGDVLVAVQRQRIAA